MENALGKLSEIKILVSEHIDEDLMVVSPKTCAKLQQWFGAAKNSELSAQPITGDKSERAGAADR